MNIKIGDFGLATQLQHENEKDHMVCGTPNYMAPEIIQAEHGYSHGVDVWSIGIIVYTLLCGQNPFKSHSRNRIFQKILDNNWTFPKDTDISL